jgi:hypothetical protein
MNLVFVNQMHPDTPHVSGMRSWYFARELARRGHRVVQICEWRYGTKVAPPLDDLDEHLRSHNWSEPLLLAVKPKPRYLLNLIRSAKTPAPLRKAFISWSYLRRSGVFTDFSDAAQPYLPLLAKQFQPTAIWGIFGNTDCWLIAQRLSQLSICPWVADMKDSWEVFLRKPLRSLLARRFADMGGCTANADFNAQVLLRWFEPEPFVVYSGVDTCFQYATPWLRTNDVLRFTLTGSVYELSKLHEMVAGFFEWLTNQESKTILNGRTIELIYAGASSDIVRPILSRLECLVNLQIHGYLPLPELASMCRSATANTYIHTEKGFHHKLLELLSCRRPVLSYPGETLESLNLADAAGNRLYCPSTKSDLIDALNQISQTSETETSNVPPSNEFSWESQSIKLEAVLSNACRLPEV